MKSVVALCCAVVGLVFVGSAVAKIIPNYIHICKASNPQYSACLLKTIESIRPRLAKGIPKLRIPPLEPMRISFMEFSANLKNVGGNLKMLNMKSYGGSNFIINSLKVDPIGLTGKVSLTFPSIAGGGEYDVDGRLMALSLKNKGYGTANCTNIHAEIQATAKIQTTNGVRHLVIDKVSSKTRVNGDYKMKMDSADPNLKGITDTFNLFVNENQKDVLEVMYPLGDEIIEDLIKQIGNILLLPLPIDEIRPL